MAISWGPWVNHLRVGIEVFNDGYDTWTPSIDVHATFHVQCDSSWEFSDQQNLVVWGNVSGNFGWFNNLQRNQSRQITWLTIPGQVQNFSGGPDYAFNARLDGVYLGAGPSHSVRFTLPARPVRPPSAAGMPKASSITPNGADFVWDWPVDGGGAPLDYNWLEIATGNFSNVIYSNQQAATNGRVVGNLAPNSTYYMRAAWHTRAGWGPWGPVGSFSTLPFQVARPTLSGVQPDSATVNWAAPAGATANGWQMQVSRNAAFTNIEQTPSSGSWSNSYTVSNLVPATIYYYRVRARTAYGYGAWSAAATSETLSGSKVLVGGRWVNGTVHVRSGGKWIVAKVNKRVGGIWKV